MEDLSTGHRVREGVCDLTFEPLSLKIISTSRIFPYCCKEIGQKEISKDVGPGFTAKSDALCKLQIVYTRGHCYTKDHFLHCVFLPGLCRPAPSWTLTLTH